MNLKKVEEILEVIMVEQFKKLNLAKGHKKFTDNVDCVYQELERISDQRGVVLGEQFSPDLVKKYKKHLETLYMTEKIDCVLGFDGKIRNINVYPNRKIKMAFVDTPNITAYDLKTCLKRKFSLNAVEWHKFLESLEDIGENNYSEVVCKLFIRENEIEKCGGSLIRAENLGCITIRGKINNHSDIDAQLAADLVFEVAMQPESTNLCVVLMSGDGDYEFALKKAKILAQSRNIDLKIIIISWTRSLSTSFYPLANKIINMDDFMSQMNGVAK